MRLYKGMKFKVNRTIDSDESHLTLNNVYTIEQVRGDYFEFHCNFSEGHGGDIRHFLEGSYSEVKRKLNKQIRTL